MVRKMKMAREMEMELETEITERKGDREKGVYRTELKICILAPI
jgi:hypothetical protein